MKARRKAYAFAVSLLDDDDKRQKAIRASGKQEVHFGKCEIQALLDYVYGVDTDGNEVPGGEEI